MITVKNDRRRRSKTFTSENIAVELITARRIGSESEITDLMMLAAHLSNDPWSSGTDYDEEIRAARNRQSQRRWQRSHGTGGRGHNQRKNPRIGDIVRVPNGDLWRVETIHEGCVYSSEGRFCPIAQVRLMTPRDLHHQSVVELADAVDRAAWALVDATEPSPLRTALEAALEAYEAEADAVSATTA